MPTLPVRGDGNPACAWEGVPCSLAASGQVVLPAPCLSFPSCAIPGFALGAHNYLNFPNLGADVTRAPIPLLNLLPALQFCAPMANPKASSSLFSQLPEEHSALIHDLSKLELGWTSSVPVLGLVLCWSCSSLGVGGQGLAALP